MNPWSPPSSQPSSQQPWSLWPGRRHPSRCPLWLGRQHPGSKQNERKQRATENNTKPNATIQVPLCPICLRPESVGIDSTSQNVKGQVVNVERIGIRCGLIDSFGHFSFLAFDMCIYIYIYIIYMPEFGP